MATRASNQDGDGTSQSSCSAWPFDRWTSCLKRVGRRTMHPWRLHTCETASAPRRCGPEIRRDCIPPTPSSALVRPSVGRTRVDPRPRFARASRAPKPLTYVRAGQRLANFLQRAGRNCAHGIPPPSISGVLQRAFPLVRATTPWHQSLAPIPMPIPTRTRCPTPTPILTARTTDSAHRDRFRNGPTSSGSSPG
jgi:hypothetical protein